MLLLSSDSFTVDGITFFPDHADPNQFWYLPGPVDLAPSPDSNEPQFLLIEYAPDVASTGVQGVGFLTFTAALRLKDETRQTAMGQIHAIFPNADNPHIAPVPFDEGQVRVVALDLQGGGGTKNTLPAGAFEVVEIINGATTPELFGDNNALFSLTLTDAGASIMKAAYDGGMAPVGVIYDMKFTGVRPELDVKVTADLKRIYDSFSVDVTAKVYWVSAGIDATFEKLRQDGAIKIEVVNLSGDQTSLDKENQALAIFKDQILSSWFTPSLSPSTAAAADAKSVGLPQQTTTTTTTTSGGSKTGGGTQTGTTPPGKSASGNTTGSSQPSKTGTGTTTTQPAAKPATTPKPATVTAPSGSTTTGSTGAAPAGAATTGTSAAGSAQGAQQGTQQSGTSNTSGTGTTGTGTTGTGTTGTGSTGTGGSATGSGGTGTGGGGGGSSTTTTQAPSTGSQIADAAKALTGGANGASNAASPFGVSVQLKVVHQDELKTVTYEYNRMDAVQRTYSPQGTFSLMLAKIDKSKHFLKVDGTDTFFKKFSVNVAPPHDFNAIGLQTAHAALDFGDPASPDTKHGEFVFDAAHSAPASWDIFQGDSMTTDFTYAVDYSFDPQAGWQGAVDHYQMPPVTTANRQLTLDPYATLGFLSVSIAPGHIDPNLVDRVDVAVQYTDGTWQTSDNFTVRSDSKPQFWKVRLGDKTKRAYTYTATCVLKDGTTFSADPVTSTANAILVNDAFHGGIDLLIQPAFDATKTKAALIEIDYTGANGKYLFQNTMFLQATNMQPTRMHVPVIDPTQRGYSYRITTIATDGAQHQGAMVTTTNPIILVGDNP